MDRGTRPLWWQIGKLLVLLIIVIAAVSFTIFNVHYLQHTKPCERAGTC
jgi:hypothetical protein